MFSKSRLRSSDKSQIEPRATTAPIREAHGRDCEDQGLDFEFALLVPVPELKSMCVYEILDENR